MEEIDIFCCYADGRMDYEEDFINAFCTAMATICKTQAGRDIIAVYAHEGYLRATDADYDTTRKVLSAGQ